MPVFVVALHIALCFFLILVVLLQPGKGADFGAAMGGSSASSDVFGATGSVSLLTKLTGVVAALFMTTSLSLAWFSSAGDKSELGIDKILEEAGADALPGSGAGTSEEPDAEGDAVPAEGDAVPSEEPAVEGDAAPTEGDAAPTEEPAGDAGAAPAEGDAAPAGDAPDEEAAPEAEAPSDEGSPETEESSE